MMVGGQYSVCLRLISMASLPIVYSRSVDPWKLCVGVKYYTVQYAILHL